MNKMKEVAELLGVELGEKFKIATNDGGLTGYYVLTESGLDIADNEKPTMDYYSTIVGLLEDLLVGKMSVKKIPFKPIKGEEYWTIILSGNSTFVARKKWNNDFEDYLRYSVGGCFKTKEEITDKVIENVINNIKGEYENE